MRNSRKNKSRVVLVGAYPPPFGGVSVHIQRLATRLWKSGAKCTVIDASYRKNLNEDVAYLVDLRSLRVVLFSRYSIIHFHASDIDSRKALVLFVLSILSRIEGNKSIVTFHRQFTDQGKLKRLISFLAPLSYVIAVSDSIAADLVNAGLSPMRVGVIPAFIPPVVRKEDADQIPEHVWSFIRSHSPLICAYAHGFEYDNGQDIYGIEQCLQLCRILKEGYPRLGMLLFLQRTKNHETLHNLRSRIGELGIAQECMLIADEPYQFYPVLMNCDMYIRPTTTDGDAVAVREALYFGIPAVASDAVVRPKGTITYTTGDLSAFVGAARGALVRPGARLKELNDKEAFGWYGEIVNLYCRLQPFIRLQDIRK